MNPTVRRSPIRLARPFSPIPLSAMVLLVWWVVAHNSGSGWVQVLGDAAFGVLLVGLFAPAAALMRMQVDLVRAPADGVAGTPMSIDLMSSGRARIRPIEPAGPECFIGRTKSGTDSQVTLSADRRGVHEEIVLEISTATPFGLQWWSRRVALRLPAVLHVSPRLGQPIRMPNWADERSGSLGRVLQSESGDARGVREYRPGDRRARVHWIASAHSGRLMVREMEQPSTQPVTLKVNLPRDEEAAERTAQSALGTAVNLLDRGIPLVLATDEGARTITGVVGDRREAGRRLARATPGSGTPGVEVLR